ncbi:MAG: A/G-specific adenine glycosylase [Opitutaceae bacterium]|nr:A/G-specific adenine glycosylase [Cytophagales bacterium]
MQYLPGLADKLINWYQINKRDLPWRHTSDPYKIWISEIIMQQTRVQQGLPYYEKFVQHFPTVQDFASASIDVILRYWQGLGYYSRARNMHYASKQILEEMSGEFPSSFTELLKLKGVGRYTAAAIASFAFDEKTPVVDGNVYRVLTRLFGISEDISLPSTQKKIELIALNHIPSGNPGLFNQAIMEFGALYCIPGKPDCPNCIFSEACFAYTHGLVSQLPVKINKVKVKERFFNYVIFKEGNNLAMRQRILKDIWSGLFEFYLIEKDKILDPEELRIELTTHFTERINFSELSETYIHILTHQKITAKFFVCQLKKEEVEKLNLKFYSEDEVENLAKPVLLLKYINK